MKKICALLLVVAVLFSLAACTAGTPSSGSGGSSGTSTSGQSSEAANSGDPSASVSSAEATAEPDSTEVPETDGSETADDALIGLLSGNDSLYESDTEKFVLYCTVSKPALYLKDEEAYPMLASALKDLNESWASEASDTRDQLLETAKEVFEQDSNFSHLACDTTLYPMRADSKALSVLSFSSTYYAGPHTNIVFTGYNFNTATGQELTLDDVLTDSSALPAYLEKRLTEKYPDVSFDNLTDNLNKLATDNAFNWTLGYDCLTFYFNTDDLAPYAAGLLTVSIGFAEEPDMFNSEYTVAPSVYSQALLMDYTQYADVDGDGKLDSICVSADADEYDTYTNLNITINGVSHSEEVYSLSYELYLVHTADGKVYLATSGTMENDYQYFRIFDISGNDVVMTDEVSGTGLLSFREDTAEAEDPYDDSSIRNELLTDPANFLTGTRSNMLSTLTARASNRITDDGKLEMLTDYYDISNNDSIVLTSKVELTLTLTEDNSEITLPAGTEFTFYRTDNSSYVDLQLSDGRICRVDVVADEWPILVNGQDAEEVFDGTVFVG